MYAPPPADGALARSVVRPPVGALAVFATSLLLGFALWPLLAGGFSWLFGALCALALEPLTFGAGGHLDFASVPAVATSLERAGSWDVRMLLGIEGVEEAHAIAVNPRRLLYLPLLTLLASVLAMPLSWAARRRVLLVGAPILSLLALLSVWLIAVFLFAQVQGLVYTLSPAQSALLHLAYEGWVTPLTSKFMLPLLLAYGLYAWQRRCEARAQDSQAGIASASTAAVARKVAKAGKGKTLKHKRRAVPRGHRR